VRKREIEREKEREREREGRRERTDRARARDDPRWKDEGAAKRVARGPGRVPRTRRGGGESGLAFRECETH